MNYQEAELKFRWIEAQRAAGRMSEQTYRDELNQLRVIDAGGRHWMMQERTGQWHMYDGAQWIPAVPPSQSTPPPPPVQPPPATPMAQPYQPTAQPVSSQPVQAERGGCLPGKTLSYLIIWLVVWIIIAAVVFFSVAKDQPNVLLGVAAGAVLSLVLLLGSLAGHWQGQIVDLQARRVKVQQDEDNWVWEDQTFASIRQPNGRIRTMRAMNGWQVGDRLEKRQGEAYIRVSK
jgi:hypothetical protein